ncbi:MAG: carbonic anhydrase family protein [Halioglobus sp.]
MIRNNFVAFTVALCVMSPLALQAAEGKPHWAYDGEHGPKHWGKLSPDYVLCEAGVNQSPVDIVSALETDLPAIVMDYGSDSLNIINNGHTAQVNVEPGSFLRVENEQYELKQFHIHVPSEHRIDGEQFLLEVHYVHQNAEGELAVVAALHREGEDHPILTRYVGLIPEEVGAPVPFKVSLHDLPIVTLDKEYYRYNGSLTTPPCSEGVRWFVLKTIRTVTLKRREIFNKLIGDDARDSQPINARIILQ